MPQESETTLEAALLKAVERTTRGALMNDTPEATREILAEIRRDVTLESVFVSPPIFQMKRQISETTIFKLACFILCDFQMSMKFEKAKVMTNSELLELADWFLTTYTHDTIKDLIFALKEARTKKQWYGRISGPEVMQVIAEHFEQKAEFIEKLNSEHRTTLRDRPGQFVSNTKSGVIPVNEQQFDKWKDHMIQFLPPNV